MNKKFNIALPQEFNSSDEMKSFYSEHGFISIKNLIPKDIITNIQNDLTFIYKEFADNKLYLIDSGILNLDLSDKKKLYGLHVISSKLTSFKAASLCFANLIAKLSDSNNPVFEIGSGYLMGLPKDNRLVYDFHQEANYMKGYSNLYQCHYPVLRTSDVNNGTMSILDKSHKLGTIPFLKSRLSENSYTNLIPNGIEEIRKNHNELHCYLELGDAVIFGKDLMHKSNFNSSELCRLVGVSSLTQSIEGDLTSYTPENL